MVYHSPEAKRVMGNFFKGVNKKEAISWAFFDFANSAYTVLIFSFVFSIFFRDVIVGGPMGDFWWGLAVSISILLGGLASPIIGAMADHDSRRKRKFVIFGVISIVGTALLYFTGPHLLLFAFVLFVITNLCFEIAQVLYDSFLIHVSTPQTAGRISGLGWGLGYVGGIVAMLLLKPFFEAGYPNDGLYMWTFPLIALFFLIFALPAFIFLKERGRASKHVGFIKLFKIGISNTVATIKEIKQHKKIAWFLAAFYLLNDALVTIFAFLPIFAKTTLGLSMSEIMVALLAVQIIGFPAALFFGWLSDKKGSKFILLTTIILWAIIVLAISFITTKTQFYIVAAVTGLVIGSSQAIARSWFSKIIPKDKRCQFFGFNGFASKVAATTGPLIFGIIAAVTADQRLATRVILVYFVISFIIFLTIKEDAFPLSKIAKKAVKGDN
jgi:UMF1 family MFS transporter